MMEALRLISIALGCVLGLVILLAFMGMNTIDSYESKPEKPKKPKKPKPPKEAAEPELPRAIVHRGDP